MPINFRDEDEVWLALNETVHHLIAEGHSTQGNMANCAGCGVLQLNLRAQQAYIERLSSSISVEQLKEIFNGK